MRAQINMQLYRLGAPLIVHIKIKIRFLKNHVGFLQQIVQNVMKCSYNYNIFYLFPVKTKRNSKDSLIIQL